ncbi:hypothetical protein B0H34DRAFT_669956 [Crassisporium funariophilum]|nr:hypothetical protein B0H34DRAFT_669956 [Crassisporium funariophilum]
MKIPSSSSLFLATLAISSSSTSLAAPAGESESVLTSARSSRQIHGDYMAHGLHQSDIDLEKMAERSIGGGLQNRDDANPASNPASSIVSKIGQMLGDVLEKISESANANNQSAEAMGSPPVINPHDMEAIQAAVNEVTRVMTNNQTMPGTAVGVIGGVAGAIGGGAAKVAPAAMNDPNGQDPGTSAAVPSSSAAAGSASQTDSASMSSYMPGASAAAAPEYSSSMSSYMPGPSAAAAPDYSTSTYESATQSASASAAPNQPSAPPNSPVVPLPVNPGLPV